MGTSAQEETRRPNAARDLQRHWSNSDPLPWVSIAVTCRESSQRSSIFLCEAVSDKTNKRKQEPTAWREILLKEQCKISRRFLVWHEPKVWQQTTEVQNFKTEKNIHCWPHENCRVDLDSRFSLLISPLDSEGKSLKDSQTNVRKICLIAAWRKAVGTSEQARLTVPGKVSKSLLIGCANEPIPGRNHSRGPISKEQN